MKYYVYKYVYNNQIIYIGKTTNIDRRISQHGRKGDNIKEKYWNMINKSDIYIAEISNKNIDYNLLEILLIQKYHPICNMVNKTTQNVNFNFKEPAWQLYKTSFDEINGLIKMLGKEPLSREELSKLNFHLPDFKDYLLEEIFNSSNLLKDIFPDWEEIPEEALFE